MLLKISAWISCKNILSIIADYSGTKFKSLLVKNAKESEGGFLDIVMSRLNRNKPFLKRFLETAFV